MVTVYDVPPNRIIDDVSEKIKEMDEFEMPDWAPYAKTGVHKEKAPTQSDWWYKRVSAIFRSIYVKGPMGISKLRIKYGGKQDRDVAPDKSSKGSGSIARTALQQLEDAGWVEKSDDGRIITAEGQSLLDNTANEIMKEMAEDNPELSKYI